MADYRKNYWFKLKDSFITSEKVDYLMSQKNGANYVIFYQILCLKCVNSNGKMQTILNQKVVKWDAEKITRDTRWFNLKFVKEALTLFEETGLIYKENDIYIIKDYIDLIGSETNSAQEKRTYRANLANKLSLNYQDNVTDNVQDNVGDKKGKMCNEILDIRDKIIDINTKKEICIKKNQGSNELNNNTQKSIIKSSSEKRFIKPSIQEIIDYCLERGNGINPEYFYNYYETRGWMLGKNHIKDWKACVRTWESRDKDNKASETKQVPQLSKKTIYHQVEVDTVETSDEEEIEEDEELKEIMKRLSDKTYETVTSIDNNRNQDNEEKKEYVSTTECVAIDVSATDDDDKPF